MYLQLFNYSFKLYRKSQCTFSDVSILIRVFAFIYVSFCLYKLTFRPIIIE